MKRMLSILAAVCVLVSLCSCALADPVSDALSAAAGMTNDELYAKAKEEAAAGAQLNFYSTTSFAEKAAANFMKDYPELDGKVVYADGGQSERCQKPVELGSIRAGFLLGVLRLRGELARLDRVHD